MWFLPFLYVLLTPAKGQMRLCTTPVYSVCRAPNPYYNSVPRNSEELKKLCPPLTHHLDCLHSYDVACTGRFMYSGISPHFNYRRLKSLLDDVCNERSPIHRALARNLPCIKRRVSNVDFICSSTKEKVITPYENYLAEDYKKKHMKTYEIKQCLNLIANVACMMEDIQDSCGYSAYTAAHDIVLRSQILPEECGLSVFLELKDVVEYLQMESNMKAKLRKYFVVHLG